MVFVDDNSKGLEATPTKFSSYERVAISHKNKCEATLRSRKLDPKDLTAEEYYQERVAIRKLFKYCNSVKPDHIFEFKKKVEGSLNCSYIESPHQADTQLVKLVKDKRIDAIFSEDGDFLIHGAPF